jgi:hypothetical protein
MKLKYQARWISKQQTGYLKKTGNLTNSLVLDSLKGHILVEPVGSNPGNGGVLPLDIADYELRSAWCQGPRIRLQRARELLGLESDAT